MDDTANPYLPAGYDAMWTVMLVLLIALLVAALVSLARTAPRLTSLQALAWTLVVILVPFVGPIVWFVIGRRAGLSREQAVSAD